MDEALTIDESVTVHAPAGDVWRAIADPEVLATWWPGMDLVLIEGATFTERWTDEDGIERITDGHVVECAPPEQLMLVWADSDWPATTRVEITIEAVTPSRSLLRVRHEGFDRLPNGDELAVTHRQGWRHHLQEWARVATNSIEPS